MDADLDFYLQCRFLFFVLSQCGRLYINLIILYFCDIYCRDEPPAKGVLTVNMALVRGKRPTGYKCVWSSLDIVPEVSKTSSVDGKAVQLSERSSKQELDNAPTSISDDEEVEEQGCCVWLPIPPEGYVALGCVAWKGQEEPPKSAALCVLTALISPCSMRDCINIQGLQR